MAVRIAIIQGHPDPQGGHCGHALAEAYAQGAAEAGHEVKRIEVTKLEFPILRTKPEWESDEVSPPIRQSQEAVSSRAPIAGAANTRLLPAFGSHGTARLPYPVLQR